MEDFTSGVDIGEKKNNFAADDLCPIVLEEGVWCVPWIKCIYAETEA